MGLTAALSVAAILSAPALALGEPEGTTWYVDDSGVGLGNGSAGTPYTSITYALTRPEVIDGDTLLVAPGDYLNESVDFRGKNVVVRSTGGPDVTAIHAPAPFDATQPFVVARFDSGETGASLEGFTLTGGTGDRECTSFTSVVGGAVVVCNSYAQILDCVITGNTAERGGGIYVVDGYVHAADTRFTGPGTGASGEAIYMLRSLAEIERCVFRDHFLTQPTDAQGGGAVVADQSTATFARCVFSRNTTSGFGGHLWSRNSDVRADECLFDVSAGLAGAGLAATNGSLELLGCTVSGSVAIQSPGAGLFSFGADVDIEDTLFTGNYVAGNREGGAIHVQGGTLDVRTSTFTSNTAGRGGAIFVGAGAVASIEGTTFTNNASPSGGAGLAVEAAAASVTRSIFRANDGRPHPTGGAVMGPVRLHRCTLHANAAEEQAGAASGGAVLTESIAWRNLPTDLDETSSATRSIVGQPFGAILRDVSSADPLFWGATDLHLLPGSPAIDAGSEINGLDRDGSRIELGALTYVPGHCDPDLGCTTGLGAEACSSVPNSTGERATLDANGSDLIALDRLVLTMGDLPPGTPVLLLASLTPNIATVPGSLGPLCLGGTLVRFSETPTVARPDGSGAFYVRLPEFVDGVVAAPSETWHFQGWFRDNLAGAPTNTTGSVSITLR